jgi:ABC-type dipeptide/oligopeptide/nickel transport system permease subunit
VTIILFATAFLGPFLSPHDPNKMNPGKALQMPNKTFLLGTDHYGRDTLSRLINGTRISIKISVFAVLIAALCGICLGTIAGYAGGIVDNVIMRVMDIFISFPPILFAIAIVAFLGTGVPHLIFAIATIYAPRFARLSYSSVLSIKENDYVQAAQALGSSHLRIICTDILPNIMPPIIVLISLSLGRAILLESGLSFLGMGPPPPEATWGNMLARARDIMDVKPVQVIWPSAAVATSVLAFNTLGDGLRDILDPRLKI